MKRALLLLLTSSLTACPGLDGWNEALTAYYARNATTVPDASVRTPNGQRCGTNADCESGQCRIGVCVVDGPVGNGTIQCGDDDDCGSEPRTASGRVCEPAEASGAGIYTCFPYTSCGKTGRVCRDNTDCFTTAGGCTSGCDRGICKVLGCQRQGSPCTTSGECCSGYLCSGPVVGGAFDAGHCELSAPATLPEGYLCTNSDQCVSSFCNTASPASCTTQSCGKPGKACGTGCCTGTRCVGSVCVFDDRHACVLDSSCANGQCLAGFCNPRFEAGTNNRICRQLALLCGDDNDCCTGVCDAMEKQCTLTPTLMDGGTCTVDPITQGCVLPGGETTCIGPHGTCNGELPCCNGMSCTNGTCF